MPLRDILNHENKKGRLQIRSTKPDINPKIKKIYLTENTEITELLTTSNKSYLPPLFQRGEFLPLVNGGKEGFFRVYKTFISAPSACSAVN